MININKIWRGFKNNLARKVDLLTQNQGEIVDELNKKVDKITSANKVYITSSTGGQEEGAYSKTNATANTFAMRGSNGVLVVGTPTADNHAATKKYVDDNVEANPTATGTETQLQRIKIGDTNYSVGGSAHLYQHIITAYISRTSSVDKMIANIKIFNSNSTPMTFDDIKALPVGYYDGYVYGYYFNTSSHIPNVEIGSLLQKETANSASFSARNGYLQIATNATVTSFNSGSFDNDITITDGNFTDTVIQIM